MTLDKQAIEILGRNRLVSELIRVGMEVAFPIRDRGIDLIVYKDRSSPDQEFHAIPIQLKGATKKNFTIDKKYEKIPHLLIIYVWGIEDAEHETFALTYQDALKIAIDLRYTMSKSWIENGKYAITNPGVKLEKLMRKFLMTPESWQEKLGIRRIANTLEGKSRDTSLSKSCRSIPDSQGNACEAVDKDLELRALGQKRQNTPPPGKYHPINRYEEGAYECDYVSPYTKSAKNVNAQVAIVLQDWASDDSLRGPLDQGAALLGYTPTAPTNVKLIQLLKTHFDLSIGDIFATNLFPFIKPGGMKAGIPAGLMLDAAKEFADPQIRIVRPKLVVCLGIAVFNTMRRFHGLRQVANLDEGIKAHFSVDGSEYWCQAHTGNLGFINREHRGGVGRVEQDWTEMSTSYRKSISALGK